MKTSDFYYDLPEDLIAQHPLENRSDSRLLVLNKITGEYQDGTFTDILSHFSKGDCLVLNDTRVIPARLYGNKEDTGGSIEFVLLKKKQPDIWEVILKPGRRAKVGTSFVFGPQDDGSHLLKATVLEIVEGGNRIVKFEYNGIFEEILDKLGTMPLPPYITAKLEDPNRYQTVYAKHDGSAAAPTAGLHFTKEVLKQIEDKGVDIAYVTLHVGLGTFRPVKVDDVKDHVMHSEWYQISAEAAEKINRCKQNGGKIFSAGTTSTRVLESAANDKGLVSECEGDTSIFIYPGYEFKCVDSLITNFHLPESTLIMLVSALAGKDNVLSAYEHAVKEKYRFFSFGDAMLID